LLLHDREKTKEALKSNTKSEIEQAKDNLLKVSHKLSEVLYSNVKKDEETEEIMDAEVVE